MTNLSRYPLSIVETVGIEPTPDCLQSILVSLETYAPILDRIRRVLPVETSILEMIEVSREH